MLEGLASIISEGYQTLKEVTCVEDVYDLIDYLIEEVKFNYPHIACKMTCSDCCKGLHPPFITAAEWEYILYYITDFPEIIQDEIIRRARYYSQQYRDALIIQNDLAKGVSKSIEEMDQNYKTLSVALQSATCPFLVLDRCGIYPVRPAKCRIHGYYLVQIANSIRVHTCLPQVSEWEIYMQKQANRKLTMPLWNVFETVISILNPPDSLVAVMPIWLITHIQGEKLLKEVNPSPEVIL